MGVVSLVASSAPETGKFRRRLLAWFSARKRDLPWRRTKDPYRIWLSEIMLQQTRVAVVVPYYNNFLLRFPDMQALARARAEAVLSHWAGRGRGAGRKPFSATGQDSDITAAQEICFERRRKSMRATAGVSPASMTRRSPFRESGATRL